AAAELLLDTVAVANNSLQASLKVSHARGLPTVGSSIIGLAPGRARGQRAAHRPDRALEPQLTQHGHPPQALRGDLLGCRQNPDGDGEVEGRAVFADVSRREIDRKALQGLGKG